MEPRVDGRDRSRGDGHLFFHVQSAIFDTLVIDPCAKSYVKAAQALLGAATIGETSKGRLYDDRCRRQDYLFYPVVLESFGGMGVRGRDLVSKIDEEGKLNGVKSIHGMRIKTYLLRALLSAFRVEMLIWRSLEAREVGNDLNNSFRDSLYATVCLSVRSDILLCRLCEETIFAVLLVVAAGSLACVSDVCVCAFTVLSSSFSFVCLSCYRWSCFLWEGGFSVFLCTTRDNK